MLAIVENMVTCEEVIVRQVHAQISLTQIEEAMRESNEAVKQAELAFKRRMTKGSDSLSAYLINYSPIHDFKSTNSLTK